MLATFKTWWAHAYIPSLIWIVLMLACNVSAKTGEDRYSCPLTCGGPAKTCVHIQYTYIVQHLVSFACKPIFCQLFGLHFYNFLPSLQQNRNMICTNLNIEFKDWDFLDSNKGFKIFSLVLLRMFCDISSSCGCLKRTHKPSLQKVHLPPYLSDTAGRILIRKKTLSSLS